VIDSAAEVKAAHNWWGVEDPENSLVIGRLAVQPVLKKPVDFKISQ